MGFQDKTKSAYHHHHHQVPTRGGREMDGGERWVVAGIPLQALLKPIFSNPLDGESDTEDCSTTTTPTGEGSRIQTKVTCPPPPPRKCKPSLKYQYGSVGSSSRPLMTWKVTQWN
ncbi:hypothetical protein CRG98_037689 [Punica granatum]|uniref:Uncharacterized protein n=2 Tax=Punica granatum TaxID=22663 RepID=A0A2I0ID80_PUNGR|nr:hypothetical protein CRG98_037689 [Punica granatum]